VKATAAKLGKQAKAQAERASHVVTSHAADAMEAVTTHPKLVSRACCGCRRTRKEGTPFDTYGSLAEPGRVRAKPGLSCMARVCRYKAKNVRTQFQTSWALANLAGKQGSRGAALRARVIEESQKTLRVRGWLGHILLANTLTSNLLSTPLHKVP
jgi:hypothetical protein